MATSTASVSGLVSGLDTASIISQLMQVEANPQTLLKTRLSTENSTITTLQSLNAKFAALSTKATALSTASSWSPLTTTSSSTSVTASTGTTASPGTVSFTVKQTALAHAVASVDTATADQVLTGADGLMQLSVNGTDLDPIYGGDGTIASVVSAINAANQGVTASAVKLDDGTFRLRMVSTTTGADSSFSLTNSDGSSVLGGATVLVAGRDAKVQLGNDTISSSSNTFSGLVTGLDVTVAPSTAADTLVDITSVRDSTTTQASVQSLVDSANELLSTIDALTAYNATTSTAGPLAGDATVRDLRSKILDAVTQTADGSSMASIGLQTDRYGKVVFDATAFATAYAADPAGVADKLGSPADAAVPGFAARLAAASDSASNADTGTLTTSILSRQSSATRMQTDIDNWDIRLAAKEAALNTQFTNLEVSLSKLKNQSAWLSSQVASLSSSSSSSSS
jgi:flagellar hook-associated protein 2